MISEVRLNIFEDLTKNMKSEASLFILEQN